MTLSSSYTYIQYISYVRVCTCMRAVTTRMNTNDRILPKIGLEYGGVRLLIDVLSTKYTLRAFFMFVAPPTRDRASLVIGD